MNTECSYLLLEKTFSYQTFLTSYVYYFLTGFFFTFATVDNNLGEQGDNLNLARTLVSTGICN